MTINEIIQGCDVISISGKHRDIEISGITCHSGKVSEKGMFIAVKGFSGDGHDYIRQAADKGACAIVYDADVTLPEEVCGIKVGNSRRALSKIASNYYGNPSSKLNLVGITGTNGKTTIATLLYDLFMKSGQNCGLLSTIANFIGTEKLETENTTSDPITINKLLSQMVEKGCTSCFMEVSSIGVEQYRVKDLQFKIGIFTNLTHDHLDYHKTFAEYLKCKKTFFDDLPKDAYAIINKDDKNGMVMVQNCRAKTITYGMRGGADFKSKIIEEDFAGMEIEIDGTKVYTMMIGEYNVYNITACHAAATLLGMEKEASLTGLSMAEAPKGRLETLRGPGNIRVIIDYAHTPDALKNVLHTIKKNDKTKKLTCLFGCGGNRDRTKRPEMAQAAQEFADCIIVTSDNSRNEKTEDIMEDIKSGFDMRGLKKTLFIADRKEAIRTAILTATPDTTVLLAGKGHETYQIINGETLHFDEREIVSETFNLIK